MNPITQGYLDAYLQKNADGFADALSNLDSRALYGAGGAALGAGVGGALGGKRGAIGGAMLGGIGLAIARHYGFTLEKALDWLKSFFDSGKGVGDLPPNIVRDADSHDFTPEQKAKAAQVAETHEVSKAGKVDDSKADLSGEAPAPDVLSETAQATPLAPLENVEETSDINPAEPTPLQAAGLPEAMPGVQKNVGNTVARAQKASERAARVARVGGALDTPGGREIATSRAEAKMGPNTVAADVELDAYKKNLAFNKKIEDAIKNWKGNAFGGDVRIDNPQDISLPGPSPRARVQPTGPQTSTLEQYLNPSDTGQSVQLPGVQPRKGPAPAKLPGSPLKFTPSPKNPFGDDLESLTGG